MVTTTPKPGLTKGHRVPTAMGRVEIATPNFPVSAQRAEMANVENSSPNGPNIAFPFSSLARTIGASIVRFNV
jgi:hypothetical protein